MSGATLKERIAHEVRKRLKRATGRDRAALLKKGAQEAADLRSSPVPEPGTIVLLLIAAIIYAGWRRRGG